MRLFLPNRKTLSDAYLPPASHVPDGKLKLLVFSFLNVPARVVVEQALSVPKDCILYASVGLTDDAAGLDAVKVQALQAHGNNVQSFFLKHIIGSSAFGTAQRPMFAKDTRLLAAGDSLTLEVKNLTNNIIARAEFVFWAVEPE